MADKHPVLDDLDVSTARTVNGKITFTISGVVADAIFGKKVYSARWSFGIYAWEIPHRLRRVLPPPPVRELAGWKLVSIKTADWPAQRSVSFRVPKGTVWGLAVFCTQAFAGAAVGDIDEPGSNLITFGPNGRSAGLQCPQYAPSTAENLNAQQPIHNTIQGADRKAAVTITVDFDYTAIYNQRGGVIEIAMYYRS
jgi:hypothetical protein